MLDWSVCMCVSMDRRVDDANVYMVIFYEGANGERKTFDRHNNVKSF